MNPVALDLLSAIAGHTARTEEARLLVRMAGAALMAEGVSPILPSPPPSSAGRPLSPAERQAARRARLAAGQSGGLVYFVRRASDGLIKIGWSDNVGRRVHDLAIEFREPMDLLGTRPGDRALERRLHEEFRDYRVTGEWFRVTPDTVVSTVDRDSGHVPVTGGLPLSGSPSSLSSVSKPDCSTRPGRESAIPVTPVTSRDSDRFVSPGDALPEELRSAASIVGVRDIDGAWLKFCGHYAGKTVHVAGWWQKWCANERRRERADVERARSASGPRIARTPGVTLQPPWIPKKTEGATT